MLSNKITALKNENKIQNNVQSKKKTNHIFVSMSAPSYPIFSKRIQREQKEQTRNKRGAYNFQKNKEYTVAEEWFQARKEARQIKIKQSIEDCELDLKIPSYEDFEYEEP